MLIAHLIGGILGALAVVAFLFANTQRHEARK
jgi:gas vesicle protein